MLAYAPPPTADVAVVVVAAGVVVVVDDDPCFIFDSKFYLESYIHISRSKIGPLYNQYFVDFFILGLHLLSYFSYLNYNHKHLNLQQDLQASSGDCSSN